MLSSGEWDKLDPLEAKFATLYSSNNINTGSKFKDNRKSNGDAWRKVKINDTIEFEGETWYWCPHHKHEDDYDGLYMKHDPDQGHKKWQIEKDKRKKQKSDKKNDSTPEVKNSQPKLILNDKLKTALMTSANMTKEQVDMFLEDFQEQEN